MKQRLRKLFERVRRSSAARWPWRRPNAQERVAFLPTERTGFTVHNDVALRLRNLSIDLQLPLGDPGPDAGEFKIRIAGSQEARREATTLLGRLRMLDAG